LITFDINTDVMKKKILLLILATLSNLFATVCDEFDDPSCNIYDMANIKVAHANFVEYKLRKNYPQFFNATGKKIRIKYVAEEYEYDMAKRYAGYVNLKEMIASYTTKTAYIVHIIPHKSDDEFSRTVAHELGHVLNFVCSVKKIEEIYKNESEVARMARLSAKLQTEYMNDISESHDSRRVEQIADAFKEYVFDSKPIPKQFVGDFCLGE